MICLLALEDQDHLVSSSLFLFLVPCLVFSRLEHNNISLHFLFPLKHARNRVYPLLLLLFSLIYKHISSTSLLKNDIIIVASYSCPSSSDLQGSRDTLAEVPSFVLYGHRVTCFETTSISSSPLFIENISILVCFTTSACSKRLRYSHWDYQLSILQTPLRVLKPHTSLLVSFLILTLTCF